MNSSIESVAASLAAGTPVSRDGLAAAARAVIAALAAAHPGHTIEVRVPPFAAGQVGALDGAGPTHRRGTPPNVVELAPETAVRLATGALTWQDAVQSGLVRYSGAHASDVEQMLPLQGKGE